MNESKLKKFKTPLAPILVILFFFYCCAENEPFKDRMYDDSGKVQGEQKQNQDIAVKAPVFQEEDLFPCSQCHAEMETNTQRRKLVDMHTEIDEIFNHDSENRWCLDCHNADNRDYLKLASGKLIEFKNAYMLCGQCHGDKYRDWKVGVHGKRTGYWNGKKQYYNCIQCHNPHSPHFKKIKPMPPPVRQEDLRYQQ